MLGPTCRSLQARTAQPVRTPQLCPLPQRPTACASQPPTQNSDLDRPRQSSPLGNWLQNVADDHREQGRRFRERLGLSPSPEAEPASKAASPTPTQPHAAAPEANSSPEVQAVNTAKPSQEPSVSSGGSTVHPPSATRSPTPWSAIRPATGADAPQAPIHISLSPMGQPAPAPPQFCVLQGGAADSTSAMGLHADMVEEGDVGYDERYEGMVFDGAGVGPHSGLEAQDAADYEHRLASGEAREARMAAGRQDKRSGQSSDDEDSGGMDYTSAIQQHTEVATRARLARRERRDAATRRFGTNGVELSDETDIPSGVMAGSMSAEGQRARPPRVQPVAAAAPVAPAPAAAAVTPVAAKAAAVTPAAAKAAAVAPAAAKAAAVTPAAAKAAAAPATAEATAPVLPPPVHIGASSVQAASPVHAPAQAPAPLHAAPVPHSDRAHTAIAKALNSHAGEDQISSDEEDGQEGVAEPVVLAARLLASTHGTDETDEEGTSIPCSTDHLANRFEGLPLEPLEADSLSLAVACLEHEGEQTMTSSSELDELIDQVTVPLKPELYTSDEALEEFLGIVPEKLKADQERLSPGLFTSVDEELYEVFGVQVAATHANMDVEAAADVAQFLRRSSQKELS